MNFWIDPLTDHRWEEFIERHPASSIFHTPAWLAALSRTYGFEPIVLTTSAPGAPLANGIPFCRIRSVLTGRRLVSLPFSDHCQPLASSEELPSLLKAAQEALRRDRLKYVELRPFDPPAPSALDSFACSQKFFFHLVDLRPGLNDIFKKCHRDCVRRKIRRAGREGLIVDAGRSDALLDDFYALQVTTRHRHGFPPQPRQWFKNLLDDMGEKATLRVARVTGRAVSAILTLRHKSTEVYKYGGSRAEDHKRGGMQLLLWTAIEDAKAAGMEELDLGRSDLDDAGLIQFKDRWGAQGRELAHYRYPSASHKHPNLSLFGKLPTPVLIAVGRLLYRHMG
jgi:hypothetical protein